MILFSWINRYHSLYDWAQGPLVWAAFIIFFVGSGFQIHRLWSLTRQVPPGRWGRVSGPAMATPLPAGHGKLKKWIFRLRLSIAGTQPLLITVTIVFHALLFLVPVFLLAHGILIETAWDIHPWVFSERLSDGLTLALLASALFFLGRRIFLARVRALSAFQDYYILFLAAAPFLTGFLAYHQIFDYRLMVTLHMLAGELMLISIPFTKITHMFLFLVLRFSMNHEYRLGRGNRVWE